MSGQYFRVDHKQRQGVAEAKVERAFKIVPDDNNDLERPTIALYIGTTGNLKIDLVDGGTVTLMNIVAGAWHPIAVKKIYATDTTCGEIVGAY